MKSPTIARCLPLQEALGAFMLILVISCPDATAEKLPKRMQPERGLCGVICAKDAPELPLKLSRSGSVLVHCIALEQATAERLGREIAAEGLGGTVTVERLPLAPLPYRDNLLNTLIIEDFAAASAAGLTTAECMRVVAPLGTLCVYRDGGWETTVKERPSGMDDWPQTYRNAGGGLVSDDTIVKFPVGLRWNDGLPFNLRIGIHNANAWTSTRGMALSGGRCFTVSSTVSENVRRTHDEMYSAKTGQHLYLTARDAWNGLLIWRKDLGDLFYGGLHYTNRSPLIAHDGRVYAVTEKERLIALDAATGRHVRTYRTEHIPGRVLLDRNTLVAATWKEGTHIGGLTGVDRRRMEFTVGGGTVEAFDAKTGRRLWKRDALATSLRSADGIVYMVVRSGPDQYEKDWHLRAIKRGKYQTFDKESGKTVEEQFGPPPSRPYQRLAALDLRSGEVLWSAGPEELELKERDHLSVDLAGLGVVVAARNIYALVQGGSPPESIGLRGRDGKILFRSRRASYAATHEGKIHVGGEMYDPETGEKSAGGINLGRTVCTPTLYVNGILTRNRGCYYTVDGKPVKYGAARGSCMFAAIPANGAFYTCQTFCNCAPGTVPGMISFGPVRDVPTPEEMEQAPVVARGPADGKASAETEAPSYSMYRGGPERNAGTAVQAPAHLSVRWTSQIAQPLGEGLVEASWGDSLLGLTTPPVAVEGTVVAADIHRHHVVAFDTETGSELWRRAVGGRVVTPPTIYRGLCLFGARDGYLRALSLQSGELAWKMQMGPDARRMVSYGQVESLWPAFGTVMVADGMAYASAGRTTESDGGTVVRAFDPLTGEQSWAKALVDIKGPRGEHPNDIVRLHDGVLYVMRSRLDPKTGEVQTDPYQEYGQARRAADLKKRKGEEVEEPEPPKEVAPYLTGTEGLACGNWAKLGARRLQIGFGKLRGGTMLAWDGELICSNNHGNSVAAYDRKTVGPRHDEQAPEPLWTHSCEGGQATAMAVCKNAVVVGGGLYPSTEESLGFIRLLSRDKGEVLSEIRLDSPLAYDGLAVTEGRIFATLSNGKLVCLGPGTSMQ